MRTLSTCEKFSFGLIAATGAVSIYLWKKIRKIEWTVGVAIEDISNKTAINVSDAIIETAVQRAVNRELQSVINSINRQLYNDINREVRESVDTSYSKIKNAVSDEVAKQVKNINIHGIEREAVAKAKDAIAEKFDNKLDGLLEEFNDNLTNISKIYSSIAKTMSDKA